MKEDRELVAQALAGGKESFAPIVLRYQGVVFSVALARVRDFHATEGELRRLGAGQHMQGFAEAARQADSERLAQLTRRCARLRCQTGRSRGCGGHTAPPGPSLACCP